MKSVTISFEGTEGQKIACEAGMKFVFDASVGEAEFTRDGNDLVVSKGGAAIILSGFYDVYNKDEQPSFEIDGVDIASADFFEAMNATDLQPAAGPGGQSAASAAAGGGRYSAYSDMALLDGINKLGPLDIGFNGEPPIHEYLASAGRRRGDDEDIAVPEQPADITVDVDEAALDGGNQYDGMGSGAVPISVKGYTIVDGGEGQYGHVIFDEDSGSWLYVLTKPFTDKTTGEDGRNTVSGADDVVITVRDQNGNEFHVTVHVNITDDVPLAVDDHNSVTEGVALVASGNVVTDPETGDNPGADGLNRVELDGLVKESPYELGPDGTVTYKGDKVGTLTMDEDGNYRFELDPSYDVPDGGLPDLIVEYTIFDNDGDSDSATLTIDVNGGEPAQVNLFVLYDLGDNMSPYLRVHGNNKLDTNIQSILNQVYNAIIKAETNHSEGFELNLCVVPYDYRAYMPGTNEYIWDFGEKGVYKNFTLEQLPLLKSQLAEMAVLHDLSNSNGKNFTFFNELTTWGEGRGIEIDNDVNFKKESNYRTADGEEQRVLTDDYFNSNNYQSAFDATSAYIINNNIKDQDNNVIITGGYWANYGNGLKNSKLYLDGHLITQKELSNLHIYDGQTFVDGDYEYKVVAHTLSVNLYRRPVGSEKNFERVNNLELLSWDGPGHSLDDDRIFTIWENTANAFNYLKNLTDKITFIELFTDTKDGNHGAKLESFINFLNHSTEVLKFLEDNPDKRGELVEHFVTKFDGGLLSDLTLDAKIHEIPHLISTGKIDTDKIELTVEHSLYTGINAQGIAGSEITTLSENTDYIVHDEQSSQSHSIIAHSTFNSEEDAGTTIHGGNVSDFISAGEGYDKLYGGAGNDVIYGDAGNDELHGEAGNDYLAGGAGDDILKGGADNDFLVGGAGNDHLYGEKGDDYLFGGTGNDTLEGGIGDDALYGEKGNDVLYGNKGNDVLDGGKGNDYIDGGIGTDFIYGGEGQDIIKYDATDIIVNGGDGIDFLLGATAVDLAKNNNISNIEVAISGNDALKLTDMAKMEKAGLKVRESQVDPDSPVVQELVLDKAMWQQNGDSFSSKQDKLSLSMANVEDVKNDTDNFIISFKVEHEVG